MPCGFCGQTGTCKTGLRKTRNTLHAESDCRLFSLFSITSAAVPTKSGPSMNHPIVYKICEESRRPQRYNKIDDDIVFWLYNMREHIAYKHPDAEISKEFTSTYSYGSHNELIFCWLAKGKLIVEKDECDGKVAVAKSDTKKGKAAATKTKGTKKRGVDTSGDGEGPSRKKGWKE